jgi:hypothetical protein
MAAAHGRPPDHGGDTQRTALKALQLAMAPILSKLFMDIISLLFQSFCRQISLYDAIWPTFTSTSAKSPAVAPERVTISIFDAITNTKSEPADNGYTTGHRRDVSASPAVCQGACADGATDLPKKPRRPRAGRAIPFLEASASKVKAKVSSSGAACSLEGLLLDDIPEDTIFGYSHVGLSEPAKSLVDADAATKDTIVDCKLGGLNASANSLLGADAAAEDTIIECTHGGLNSSASSSTCSVEYQFIDMSRHVIKARCAPMSRYNPLFDAMSEDTNSVGTHRGLSEPANSLLGADAAAEVTIIECKPRGLNASASPLLDTDVATEDTIIECTPGGLNASANSLTDANHEDNYHLDSLNSSPCLLVKPCNLRPLEACVHVIVDGVPTCNPEDGLLWENLFGAESESLLSDAHAVKLSMHEHQFARPLLGFSRGRDVLALIGVSRAHVNLIGEM